MKTKTNQNIPKLKPAKVIWRKFKEQKRELEDLIKVMKQYKENTLPCVVRRYEALQMQMQVWEYIFEPNNSPTKYQP
jgi:hypothetical protein